jgi:putative transposase
VIRATYKFRLYPTKQQTELLGWTLACCQELYNAALQERRDAWRINRVSVNYAAQAVQLPEIKTVRPELRTVYSQVLQDALRRVDKHFQAFFARVRRNEKPGFPRFRPLSRYDSFTYPQQGFGLSGGKLQLSKIGKIKIKVHRPIEGKVKTLTVKRECGRWYAVFTVERESRPLPESKESVGMDVGIASFFTLSDGTVIENPKFLVTQQAKVRRAQRTLARRKKGSKRREKAKLALRLIRAGIKRQRGDFHHQVSRRLVNRYGLIAIEDLNVKGLARGMLAKSVLDAAWASFFQKLTYKAAWAGRELVKVDARGTSQSCLCGAKTPKELKDRRHACEACGLSAPRDLVSAQIILGRGLRLQSVTCSGS